MHVQEWTAGRRGRKTGWVIRPVRREQCAQPGHVCELVSALLCEGHTERICLVRSVKGGGFEGKGWWPEDETEERTS